MCDLKDDHFETHKRELNLLYPGVDIHLRKFDASDEKSVKAVVEEALQKYGRLDIFFANAGIASGKLFTETSDEEFMRMLKANTLSVFLAAKYAAKAMMKNKPYPTGAIIGTASVAGIRSNAGGTDYSASKAAIVSIMQTCAYQLAGTGIRCNAICPGIIETGITAPMYEMARQRGTERKIGQLNPLKRGGVADEVARVVLFLASDEASYVNGQAIPVCGGLSAGHPYVVGKLS
jgi:NAD(P)-dependent dehydrogenase (short-subunit alcohol dehydrogenase family)